MGLKRFFTKKIITGFAKNEDSLIKLNRLISKVKTSISHNTKMNKLYIKDSEKFLKKFGKPATGTRIEKNIIRTNMVNVKRSETLQTLSETKRQLRKDLGIKGDAGRNRYKNADEFKKQTKKARGVDVFRATKKKAELARKGKVKFVRIRGRIVPIRIKGKK